MSKCTDVYIKDIQIYLGLSEGCQKILSPFTVYPDTSVQFFTGCPNINYPCSKIKWSEIFTESNVFKFIVSGTFGEKNLYKGKQTKQKHVLDKL